MLLGSAWSQKVSVCGWAQHGHRGLVCMVGFSMVTEG